MQLVSNHGQNISEIGFLVKKWCNNLVDSNYCIIFAQNIITIYGRRRDFRIKDKPK